MGSREFPFSLEGLLDGGEVDGGAVGGIDFLKAFDEIVDAGLGTVGADAAEGEGEQLGEG